MIAGVVAGYPSFGVLLARLLQHRGTSITWLSTACGVAEPELRSVIEGAAPTEPQLRALAPALGLHAADLFVMADVSLPEDLAALDPAAGYLISPLVSTMMALPTGRRRRVHRLIGQLPQETRPRDEPASPRDSYDQHEVGFGAMLMNMLCGNRNVPPNRVALIMFWLTRGRMYLSRVTYPAIGRGSAPLRPEWVAEFSIALGIPAGDLAAVAGIELPDAALRDDPLASEMAELIWNLRRLSAAQAEYVLGEANRQRSISRRAE